MSDKAIVLDDISKRYRIGGGERYLALRDTLTRLATSPFRPRRTRVPKEYFWALNNVSFDVDLGEIVGIIGRNGAGKSTLLKILTRITLPTTGIATINGRVGSLLEVGTGFHPELTGRENIYFNGVILGMSKRDIDRRFDDIVAFAETERFVDTVVKHYSSGMQVRLAFAVAAHLEPDVLFVDEVLTVGDLRFQRKCLDKMAEIAETGQTVIFVSHQMNQIRRLARRVIWLDNGKVEQVGPTDEVVAAYEAASFGPTDGQIPDQGATRVTGWHVRESGSEAGHVIRTWDKVKVTFHVNLVKDLGSGQNGVALYSSDGLLVWADIADGLQLPAGTHELMFTLPYLPLKPGLYRWRVSLWEGDHLLDLWEGEPQLLIATQPVNHLRDEWAGVLNLPAEFTVRTRKS